MKIDTQDLKKTVIDWVKNFENSKSLKSDGFDSYHIDELTKQDISNAKDQIEVALQAYDMLISELRDQLDIYMPTLAIECEEVSKIVPMNIKSLLGGKVILATPPELYIIKRKIEIEPYVLEEYKTPVSIDFRSENGRIYSYYSCQRRLDESTFTPILFLECYPLQKR